MLEEAARDAQVKPRSKAEEFIVKIARAVEGVMQRELVPLPQGTTIIPSEYTIFLSDADDKEWQGVKRRGLEQGLYHILAERAKEIAGKKKLETKSFVIELRVDGTLEKGERPRPAQLGRFVEQQNGRLGPAEAGTASGTRTYKIDRNTDEPEFSGSDAEAGRLCCHRAQSVPQTLPNASIEQAVPITSGELEEMTNVRKRAAELYRLEIWLNGVRQNVVPIFQNEIAVGRGSKSKPVDIALKGDPEISRRHLTIIADGSGHYWAVNEGRNAAAINNYELPAGQRVSLAPGVSLSICSYVLRIQPK